MAAEAEAKLMAELEVKKQQEQAQAAEASRQAELRRVEEARQADERSAAQRRVAERAEAERRSAAQAAQPSAAPAAVTAPTPSPPRGQPASTAAVPGAAGPVEILNQANIEGADKSLNVFKITVPAGTTTLEVFLEQSLGDLYVKRGSPPVVDPVRSTSQFDADCASMKSNYDTEACRIANPAAGEWFIGVFGYHAYYGSTVRAVVYNPTLATTTAPTCATESTRPMVAVGTTYCTSLSIPGYTVAGTYVTGDGERTTTLQPDGSCTWMHNDGVTRPCRWGIIVNADGSPKSERFDTGGGATGSLHKIIIANYATNTDLVLDFHVVTESRRLAINRERFKTY